MAPAEDKDNERPLYIQVRDQLVERIRTGPWKPGQLIPNEFEIAAEFKVSQGTARKALAALAETNLVVRRQGLGTFVFEHTPAHVLFRFFNMFDDKQAQIIPKSKHGASRSSPGRTRSSAPTLRLGKNARVIRISAPAHAAKASPSSPRPSACRRRCFPGLADHESFPNTLYDLYQKDYGVSW